MILSETNGWIVSKHLPHEVIKLANMFWTKVPKTINYDSTFLFMDDKGEVEDAFGLERDSLSDIFPSAYKTPIYILLKNDTLNTIDFVIDFINTAIEKYAHSEWEYKENIQKVEVHISNDSTQMQYHSQALWNLFRGTSSPVMPKLLQSSHMALEKYLLEVAQYTEHKTLETILLYILKKSKSSSLSAIISSVVLANHNKTVNVAI
ncbi:MAG TPA: hypothetical protein ENK75_00440 [Saprospiraceae bacterium]|nr:hypothetical protein [Saprospiraceae bacterium]